MNASEAYVIGVDFGTDSVRTIIADAATGAEVAASVYAYPRWKQQLYCNASMNQFRQHPQDYIDGLEYTIRDCIARAGEAVVRNIRGLSVDTTGSTPVAVDRTGTPLSLLPAFAENPNAMFVLWKDHTAVQEAAQINTHAAHSATNYLQFVGGIYSSEWYWAKLLHILREDAAVRAATWSFVEHCDWIPFLLTGGDDAAALKRGVCAAGHKMLWAKEWGGLPPNHFFQTLDPLLDGFTGRIAEDTCPADQPVGIISKAWAKKLRLPETVIIGVGAFDAHMGAVGGQIEPYYLSKVMGTSTCDMLVAPLAEVEGKLVRGICGQVPGSVIPGMMGMEAGQSAFGDAYAWFKSLLSWPMRDLLSQLPAAGAEEITKLIEANIEALIPNLSRRAAELPLSLDAEISLDWFNGRRTPDASQVLTATISGLNLGSDAVSVFRSIVEATCFGAKAIVDRFISEGIPVKGLIGLGGVAKKSPFIMQMLADVINMPIRVHRSEQTCALGAAMFAATAAGLYATVEEAMHAMGQGFDATYDPDSQRSAIYAQRYVRYQQLGHFIEMQALKNSGQEVQDFAEIQPPGNAGNN